jgi:hypothetical protein
MLEMTGSRIEAKALRKLRHPSRSRTRNAFLPRRGGRDVFVELRAGSLADPLGHPERSPRYLLEWRTGL